MMLYLVVFRLAGSRRREQVTGILRRYGWEVTPGAYECPLHPDQAGELLGRLKARLKPEDDLRMYQVCDGCLGRSWRNGVPEWAELPAAWVY